MCFAKSLNLNEESKLQGIVGKRSWLDYTPAARPRLFQVEGKIHKSYRRDLSTAAPHWTLPLGFSRKRW